MNETDTPKKEKEADRTTINIYMGSRVEGARRLTALDALCARLGINRSQLLMNIADGRFGIQPYGGRIVSATDLDPEK